MNGLLFGILAGATDVDDLARKSPVIQSLLAVLRDTGDAKREIPFDEP